ncbi:MAG: hypothetical protein NXH79_14380 [Rhodobacteraceae bacterium]|jgi:hypothetical protein|nr:hypothetical protein [Paracoccaceae bacterium]
MIRRLARLAPVIVLLPLLAACVTTPREPEPPTLVLDGGGLLPNSGPLRIDFGREQTGVIDVVSRLLDETPVSVSTNTECGAGPVTAATWEDGLTLNFLDGAFAGWTSSDPAFPVAGGFVAGQPRLEMPQTSFQVTTLGTEFNRGDIFGLLNAEETEVGLLWAGVTCFFR